jgi:hypothetical protein
VKRRRLPLVDDSIVFFSDVGITDVREYFHCINGLTI